MPHQIPTILPETMLSISEGLLYLLWTRYYWTTQMDELKEQDLKSEIQCRIDYFKQLCRDRQFVDQEMWHYYRGSASALNALLSYMERGITGYPDKKTNETTEVPLNISEKVLKGKEQKGLELREVLEKFSIPRNSSRK